MSTEKLIELSKPVAEIRKHYPLGYDAPAGVFFQPLEGLSAVNFGDLLYSQEYVSALTQRIAELERARFIAWPGAMFAPVLARIKVDVKHRDGSLSVGKSAGNVVWYHSDSPSDVVAFALAVEGDEP
ncbi:hypothetical protein IM817_11485 [Serratia marcescens]|uniref:hypothetical protein n=1 Tax=Serratia marcescens TaxID=615 RepID=UPI001C5814ED|nr:hypothetical protein [Serratia marcescens]QXX98748.1 hypothetical protein IM817_11485 [Serratia marcescens]